MRSYSEAELSVKLCCKARILGLNEFLSSCVGILDWLTNFQGLDYGIESFIGNDVGLLLSVVRIDQDGPTRHDIHVLVLAADVDIDSLSVKDVLV